MFLRAFLFVKERKNASFKAVKAALIRKNERSRFI